MPQQIRMWEVTEQDTLAELEVSKINLEKQLENWLESDISILDDDLLVIGRQVRTDFGGVIDLLCLDSCGNLVAVELKRGQAPREVTAQALDYASWVKDLSFERIREIASGYLKLSSQLEVAFEAKFGERLPDTLNVEHRSLIVAESMDASTERIVRYLSDMNVPINVATVQHFTDKDGRALLAQVFLIEPEEAQAKAKATSKRASIYGTVNSVNEMADANGIGHLYGRIREGVRRILNATPYGSEVGYHRRLDDGGTRTVMFVNAVPNDDGGMKFVVHATRFDNYLGIGPNELMALLPDNSEETTSIRRWVGSLPEDKGESDRIWRCFPYRSGSGQIYCRLAGE